MDIDYPGADDEDDDDDGVLPLQDFEACSMIEIQLGGATRSGLFFCWSTV